MSLRKPNGYRFTQSLREIKLFIPIKNKNPRIVGTNEAAFSCEDPEEMGAGGAFRGESERLHFLCNRRFPWTGAVCFDEVAEIGLLLPIIGGGGAIRIRRMSNKNDHCSEGTADPFNEGLLSKDPGMGPGGGGVREKLAGSLLPFPATPRFPLTGAVCFDEGPKSFRLECHLRCGGGGGRVRLEREE
ncbi:hypothetical protein CEXT_770551 [Caerostris extrusa]|uniref:Uncharacterized protein n=1 Tax=Caerostris extrusa TaxID=172846 RepID=A0AAV4U4D1_CAEEX|nr:hypothetical protein CEXT_770551 [Caerostris extrusa]